MTDNASGKEIKTLESNNTNHSQGECPDKIQIEVYRHYRELALNEDRLINERLMVFLTSHSILFLGYIMSLQVKSDNFSPITDIRIVFPIIGIVLCIIGFLLFLPAKNAWKVWEDELTTIENKVFKKSYTLTLPNEARKNIEKKCLCSGKLSWRICCIALPMTFLSLWVYVLYLGWA